MRRCCRVGAPRAEHGRRLSGTGRTSRGNLQRTPETVQEFVAFLALVERALPLAERPALAEMGMARRLHAASGGVMAYLMELLRGATYLALAEGRPTLDREVLGRAFAQRLASVRRGTANPFRDADDAGTEVDARASQRDAGDAPETARVVDRRTGVRAWPRLLERRPRGLGRGGRRCG